eukprot:TRINITY_DN9647_c0_g1_i7.p3 TRINITY_DN9647_c0_g1~~TRINITY_DN9647_c0_g1_i7.p3  ORF type:complete len:122 (+),score=52.59 TRINITY_DN9647_c0_g1_i7:973-1338(+)
METFNFGVPTVILQPREAVTKDNVDQAQESLSHVCAAIADVCLATNTLYNLLITDRGMTFYMMPRRKEQKTEEENPYNLGVFDLSGAFYVLDKEKFGTVSYKEFIEYCLSLIHISEPTRPY